MHNSEKEYLKHYNIHDYDVPLVSVDVAIFTLLDGKLHILMVERGEYPQKGRWSLPGVPEHFRQMLHNSSITC